MSCTRLLGLPCTARLQHQSSLCLSLSLCLCLSLSLASMLGNPKITVVLVGGGTIAPLHAQYLMSSPAFEVVAIVDPYLPGQKLATELSLPLFESVSALLAASLTQSQPDVYVVCVPSNLHVRIATEILHQAQPKAMLIEKPLAVESRSATELLDLAKQKSCKILVGHHRRFHPSLSVAREAILQGRIGTITAVSGLWTAKKGDDYFRAAGWRASRSAGGGPIWTNFVHDVDAVHFLTGSRIVRVWATSTPPRRSHQGVVAPEDAVEEGAAVMAQLSNGAVCSFIVSDNTASPYGWESATADNPLYAGAEVSIDTYRIMGTHGTLSIPNDVLWTYDAEEAARRGVEISWNMPMSREVLDVPAGIPFKRQAQHLARVVRGAEEPLCSGDDGLAAVRVCEAILEALKAGNGAPVSIHA